MHDNLELVARPEEVHIARMDNGLDWRTASDSDEKSPLAPPLLANRNQSVIYFVGAGNGLVKIGFAKHFLERLGKLACGSPVPLVPLATTPGGREEERYFNSKYSAWRRHGEWFELTDQLEDEIDRINTEQNPCYRPHRERAVILPLTLTNTFTAHRRFG